MPAAGSNLRSALGRPGIGHERATAQPSRDLPVTLGARLRLADAFVAPWQITPGPGGPKVSP